jgi:hypothetical protein
MLRQQQQAATETQQLLLLRRLGDPQAAELLHGHGLDLVGSEPQSSM